MYAGRIVETADTESLFERPVHPYTRALLASVPVVGKPPTQPIAGEPANPRRLPRGCRFQARCPLVQGECRSSEPTLDRLADGRSVRCIKAASLLHERPLDVAAEEVLS
jgi:peptide/nickel transport system ATP-binding protein